MTYVQSEEEDVDGAKDEDGKLPESEQADAETSVKNAEVSNPANEPGRLADAGDPAAAAAAVALCAAATLAAATATIISCRVRR